MGDVFFRRVFLAGALWNILGGLLIVLGQEYIFGRQGLSIPLPSLFYYLWIAMVEIFGIGYLMVWRDPYGNKSIVILGIMGKLVFSIAFAWHNLTRRFETPDLFWVAVIGDLVFVVLYWMFLNSAVHNPQSLK